MTDKHREVVGRAIATLKQIAEYSDYTGAERAFSQVKEMARATCRYLEVEALVLEQDTEKANQAARIVKLCAKIAERTAFLCGGTGEARGTIDPIKHEAHSDAHDACHEAIDIAATIRALIGSHELAEITGSALSHPAPDYVMVPRELLRRAELMCEVAGQTGIDLRMSDGSLSANALIFRELSAKLESVLSARESEKE